MFLGTWMPFFWSWKMHKHLLEPAWDFPIHPTGVESRVGRWSWDMHTTQCFGRDAASIFSFFRAVPTLLFLRVWSHCVFAPQCPNALPFALQVLQGFWGCISNALKKLSGRPWKASVLITKMVVRMLAIDLSRRDGLLETRASRAPKTITARDGRRGLVRGQKTSKVSLLEHKRNHWSRESMNIPCENKNTEYI